jgi:hypothetical protein
VLAADAEPDAAVEASQRQTPLMPQRQSKASRRTKAADGPNVPPMPDRRTALQLRLSRPGTCRISYLGRLSKALNAKSARKLAFRNPPLEGEVKRGAAETCLLGRRRKPRYAWALASEWDFLFERDLAPAWDLLREADFAFLPAMVRLLSRRPRAPIRDFPSASC